MIVAIMGYGLAVGGLAAFAAWLIERAQAAFGAARKLAWIAGIIATLLVPSLVIGLRKTGESYSAPMSALTESRIELQGIDSALRVASTLGEAEWAGWSLDNLLVGLWLLASASLIGLYAFSVWRLRQRAQTWRATRIGAQHVVISPDMGPAVFGWTRPRVVFPRWLTQAPPQVQALALAHECEHARARDPQLLSAATLLAALLPWNLPLLWMLRRLRFAMEVDCDARVIRRGADPHDYGLALLYVSENQARAPFTAVALIERTSQLERRINFMFSTPRKHRALLAGACLALAGSCLYAAGKLEAPAFVAAAPVIKLPPGNEGPGFKLGQRFELLIREKYPELIGGNFEGVPMIVVLLDDDWNVPKSAKTVNPDPKGNVSVTNEIFRLIGEAPEDVPYVGAMNMLMAKDKFVSVVYTQRKNPDGRINWSVFPDTRKQDRELFAQQFPAASSGVAAGVVPWVLMDRSGVVLRRGLEPVTGELHRILETRYRINTAEVTVTPITNEAGEPLRDAAGKALHLHSVWLAPGSTAPEN